MNIASINDILCSRERIRFRYRINITPTSDAQYNSVVDWCQEHCTDVWRSTNYHMYATYFQFDDEKDVTMFMLRWGALVQK
jgi:hypothetical protein